MGTLDGHHALITGGGTGIGAAIARALAAEGASLSLVGRRRGPIEEVAASLPRAMAITADVTREDDCTSMIEAARAAHGPLDIVVANAGAAESAPAGRTDLALWRRMIDVNLTGAFLTARSALSDLCRAADTPPRSRRIVFVASTAGLKGYPYVAAYSAAKHGVVGLAHALAAELATRDVTVNAVCPGFTETPLLESSIANIIAKTGRTESSVRGELARGNPQGRFITPGEVAATVAFLASPAASAVTGQAISISRGEQ
jgi:NAD(P)-dependent dehydrogenase (short-subunit alcohol dehydrogenase family)